MPGATAGSISGCLLSARDWPAVDVTERLKASDFCPLLSVRLGPARLFEAECDEIAAAAEAVARGLTQPGWVNEAVEVAREAASCSAQAQAIVQTIEKTEVLPDLPAEPTRDPTDFAPEQLPDHCAGLSPRRNRDVGRAARPAL
jgi:hypothetical protein